MNRKAINTEEQILKYRAQQLAMPKRVSSSKEQNIALLQYTSMGYQYAVPLASIEAVGHIDEVLPVPQTPNHIVGIMRRLGRAVALIDLRRFFHPDIKGISDSDYAIIVKAKGKFFALEAEDIEGVVLVEKQKLLPPPDNIDSTEAPFISAVTVDGICIMDLEKLVDAEGFSQSRVSDSKKGGP